MISGPEGRLAGRIAVVTGGARGIGREVALELARSGAQVAVSGREASSLEDTLGELDRIGGRHAGGPCEVTDWDSVQHFAAMVRKELGEPDIVIANAGVAGPTKLLHETSLEEWRECVQTDLEVVFLTFKAFIPAMIEARRGVLLAMSSMTGKRPLVGRTPYAAAKMGLIGLCRTLAAELGGWNIRVNSVCPGAVAGPRITAVVANQAQVLGITEAEAMGRFTEPAALRRLVDPKEVARVCAFLASDAASGVTGEDVNVSAGVVMY